MSKLESNRASHFKVSLDSITVADFREVQGLDLRSEVLEYREGGLNERSHKVVGQTRFERITLGRGTSDSLELFRWIQGAIQGKVERKNGAVLALNQAGEVVARWEFRDAWPCAYEGPDFEADLAEIAIERLTLAHRGWALQPGDVKTPAEPAPAAARSSEGGATDKDSGGKAGAQATWPPRTPAAEEACEVACAAADRAGISKRKVRALAVFTVEDAQGNPEEVHVGLSGGIDPSGAPTDDGRKRSADLQRELDKEPRPPTYVVHDSPKSFPGYTGSPGDPGPGNCAEPKAANYEGPKDGFDVRYRGREGDWEQGHDRYALEEGSTPTEAEPNPQMRPCNTCEHNRGGILAGGGA